MGGGEVRERKANNEQGKHLTQCERREPAEEAGCPPKLSHILDFRELTTGEGGRHLSYLHTGVPQLRSSIIPSLSFAQRTRTQAPMFEPLLQALDTRNGRAHTTEKDAGQKDATWTQTWAMASNQGLPFLPLSSLHHHLSLSYPQLPVPFHSLYSTPFFALIQACTKEESVQTSSKCSKQSPEKCMCDLMGATDECSMLSIFRATMEKWNRS